MTKENKTETVTITFTIVELAEVAAKLANEMETYGGPSWITTI